MRLDFNTDETRKALELLKPDGELFEIRGIKGKENISGYFTDIDSAVNALAGYSFRDSANWQLYFTLNQINPACYSRGQSNKFLSSSYGNKLTTTSKNDITSYRLILIDFDPQRPSETSSSNEELEAAHQKAVQVFQKLKEYGFPEPVTAMSGNGYHLLYRVNLDNTAENEALVGDFLKAADNAYSDSRIKIDTAVKDPNRICKLYGTTASKGTSTEERPHRQSKILTVPSDFTEVPKELLQRFVDEHKPKETTKIRPIPQTHSSNKNFNLAEWISMHNVPIRTTETKGNDTYYILENCPFNSEHTGKDSAVIQKSDGTLCFNCFHDSCSGKTWKDFRLFYEPDAYEKKKSDYNIRIKRGQAETDQELAEVLEAAESNVLDRKIVEYACSCNYIEELNFLYADLLKLANAQGLLKEFKELWKEVRKEVAKREGQIRARERNENKDYNFDKTGNCTIENVAYYLEQNHIRVKYNEILHRMEITGFKGENQDQIVENAPAIIESTMQQSLEYCTQARIASYMNVLAARNRYNPVLEKLHSTRWDGNQRLNKLFEMLGIMDDSDENHYNRIFVKKWLMQCICGLHNTVEKPFSLDIVLVFKGKQGIGKTRLLEALSLNSLYFGDGVVLDVRNKDDVQQSTSKWICELGEISSTFKKDMDSLKAFISKSIDEYRVPYGKTSVQYPRITSFCGTVNDDEFLIDRTGNRRFAVVPLQDDLYIDYDDIKNFNFLQLWAEINSEIERMVKSGKSYAEIFRFNRAEVAELEKRNGVFIKPLPGQKEVEDILAMTDDWEGYYRIEWKYLTVSEFIDHWSNYLKKYSTQQIGIVLKFLGISTDRVSIDGQQRRLKKLPVRTFTKQNND